MNRFISAFATLLLASCSSSSIPPLQLVLSPRFDVCGAFPDEAVLLSYQRNLDYDTASFSLRGTKVEAIIGGHPNFSMDAIRRSKGTTDGFKLLGKERSDGEDKILFGEDRGSTRGPVLVMFSAADLGSVSAVFDAPEVIIDCD